MVFFLSGFLVYWWKVSDRGGESIKNCYNALMQSIIYYMLKLSSVLLQQDVVLPCCDQSTQQLIWLTVSPLIYIDNTNHDFSFKKQSPDAKSICLMFPFFPYVGQTGFTIFCRIWTLFWVYQNYLYPYPEIWSISGGLSVPSTLHITTKKLSKARDGCEPGTSLYDTMHSVTLSSSQELTYFLRRPWGEYSLLVSY